MIFIIIITGDDRCYGYSVDLYYTAYGSLSNGTSFSIGSVQICENNSYSLVCNDAIENDSNTLGTLCYRAESYRRGLAYPLFGNIGDYLYPLTNNVVTDIECSPDDYYQCNVSLTERSTCMNEGGNAVITCLRGKFIKNVIFVFIFLFL